MVGGSAGCYCRASGVYSDTLSTANRDAKFEQQYIIFDRLSAACYFLADIREVTTCQNVATC